MEQEKLSDIPMREYIERVLEERDRLYSSKFIASEIAVAAALASSEKAVNAAFLSQQTAMQTALVSAEKAVSAALTAADRAGAKAELASEKRFEALNELRAMVSDQQAAFMQRLEAVALFKAADDKLESMRINFDKSLESVDSEISTIREQIANLVNRNEFQTAKDQAALSIKTTSEHTALLITRTEFDATREQFVQSQKVAAERGALYITRDEMNAMRMGIEKSVEGLSKEIASLRESRSEVSGKSAGINALWGYLVAIASIVMAVIFHFIK